MLLVTAMLPTVAWSADGDVFKAQTAEGAEMSFIVISEEQKTCQVGGVYSSWYISLNSIEDYEGPVTIPAEANGYKVVKISRNAFASKLMGGGIIIETGLHVTAVNIPSTVTTIEGGAFNYSEMEEVVFPESVTNFGEQLFMECPNLAKVKLPQGITYLPRKMFSNCTSPVMDNYQIPETIEVIGEGAFSQSALSNIVIPAKVTTIEGDAFWDTKLTSIVIPATVKYVGYSAFSGCPLTQAELLSSETVLGNSVFKDTKLTTFKYPNGTIETGDFTFRDCKDLESVELPMTVKAIGRECFCGCSSLTNINLPEGLTYIGQYGLSYTSFSQIILPSTLETIESFALTGCKQLTSITIPASVSSIGQYTFAECEGLESVDFKGYLNSLPRSIFKGCKILSNITLPKNLTRIERWAFEYCDSLKEFVIPDGLSVIEEAAFRYSGLTSVILPNTLNAVEGAAFCSCQNLESVELQNPFVWLGDGVFSFNHKLTSFTFPEGMEHTGNSTLFDCPAITQINLPSTLKTIGNAAFDKTGITSITLPESLINIGNDAFVETPLISITLPSSLQSIGYAAFYGCNLEYIESKIEIPFGIPDNVFGQSVYENAYLCVPEGSIDMYRNTPAWNKFLSISSNPTGIHAVQSNTTQAAVVRHTLGGQVVPPTYRGIFIEKTKDGTTRKILTK